MLDANLKNRQQHGVAVNSAWLIGDKIVRLGLNIVITVWLARHFGPEGFGVWNFATAFVALFGVFAVLGMDGIIVRELVTDRANAGRILGTALTMRLAAATIAATAAVAAAFWVRGAFELAALLVALNSLTLVFQGSQVVEYYFQADMRARAAVVAANAAFLITSIVRLLLLALGASIAWFGVSLVVEAALAACFLAYAYRRDGSHVPWSFSFPLAKRLLGQSWPLLLSGFAVMAYMRLDQVMLATMLDDHAVGVFSAALRIAEVWYFIPMAIAAATFPRMLEKRSADPAAYRRYIQALYDSMAWLGLAVAVLVSVFAGWLIPLLYGQEYAEAAKVLSIQIWAGIAVAMSYVHSRWLLAENLQKYGLYYTLTGAVVNILLNFLLIPRYGPAGAAWATLATQIGLLPIQLFFKRARGNFLMMLNVVAAPARILRAGINALTMRSQVR